MQNNKAITVMQLHLKIFGVEPVITGINAMNEKPIDELILESIDKGVPYVEKEPTKGVLY